MLKIKLALTALIGVILLSSGMVLARDREIGWLTRF